MILIRVRGEFVLISNIYLSACYMPGIFFKVFFFFNFNWRLITLQYCGSFCHTFTWISHGCTCAPHPDPPSHLPPNAIPQGHPSVPALSTLSHASNLDWQSVSHMIIHDSVLFSQIIPPSPSPHRVQKTVLYVCVSFAISHIGSSLPSF